MESEKEKEIREHVKRLNPYDFWVFVRSNIHDSKLEDSGRSQYYQESEVGKKRFPKNSEFEKSKNSKFKIHGSFI